MLGSRGHLWKVLAGLGIFVAACAWSGRRGEDINPAYWRCRLQPDRFDGTSLWFPSVTVTAPGDGRFEIGYESFRIPVSGSTPEGVKAGDEVGLTAVFRKEGPLEAIEVRRRSAVPHVRLILNVAWVAALAFVAVCFLLAFRIRWSRMALKPVPKPGGEEARRG